MQDLCRLAGGVPEPQGDGHDVDSGLEQAHRGGVSQDVRGNPLARKGWAWAGRAGGVMVQPGRYRLSGVRGGVGWGAGPAGAVGGGGGGGGRGGGGVGRGGFFFAQVRRTAAASAV